MRRLAAAGLLILLACGASPAPKEGFLRGMTITCPRSGQIWGTQAMAEALAEVRSLGVQWVAIHPYARIGRDGSVGFRPADAGPGGDGTLARAVAMSRQQGLKMFWKPHLAYWGNFAWRGEIQFGDDEAAWKRFFEGYRGWILDQAAFAEAQGLPLFAVGVELDATAHREEEWRQVIAEVRKVYKGHITYAANWDTFEKVPFWDAVDLIGVQAYFPLSSADDPSRQELTAGWRQALTQLAAHSRRIGSEGSGAKRVLFTEIGYNRAPNAAREPWDYHVDDTPAHRRLRQRLMETAIEVLEQDPLVAGLFWWKWMPGSSPHRSNFSMRDPEARAVLQDAWGAEPAPSAVAGER